MAASEQITAILADLAVGEEGARDRLLTAIYQELRRVAAAQLRQERPNHTLQPTALVHEACMRLLRTPGNWKNREHLFRTAAQMMRRILTDYARARGADKRGGLAENVAIDDLIQLPAAWSGLSMEEMIALDAAIDRLKEKDERQSIVVEMRFFAGLSEEEIAEALQVSARTVKRDWESARSWLYGQLRVKGN
ncbi:ECF-type sigma factor [uncultured Paludibaculum sp.]|uniref:ECF-type sigma factor n=1 Tax=uncultured Paludibaculum sp. TaxID=1765020 RepID=UPI002AABA8D2|nr:ECF-type sigma factor [uncultured Paludibaculum sp.]